MRLSRRRAHDPSFLAQTRKIGFFISSSSETHLPAVFGGRWVRDYYKSLNLIIKPRVIVSELSRFEFCQTLKVLATDLKYVSHVSEVNFKVEANAGEIYSFWRIINDPPSSSPDDFW